MARRHINRHPSNRRITASRHLPQVYPDRTNARRIKRLLPLYHQLALPRLRRSGIPVGPLGRLMSRRANSEARDRTDKLLLISVCPRHGRQQPTFRPPTARLTRLIP